MSRKRHRTTDKAMPALDPEIEAAIEDLLDLPTHSQLIADLETDVKKRSSYAHQAISYLTSRAKQKR